MKKLTLLLILPFLLSACVNKGSYKSQNNDLMGKSIYDFKVEDLSGEEFDFASLKGKKNYDCQYRLEMWPYSAIRAT
jgi:glutathione peroxidase